MEFFDSTTHKYQQPTQSALLQALKPIETRHNGYHFRSRNEARWAVLFDSMGIQYEYEPEGFELICGPYLPDFWLPYPDDLNFSGYPGAGHWVEVKGTEPTQHEITKLLHLSIATNHSGILVWGTPWNFRRYFTHRCGNYGIAPVFEDDVFSDAWILLQRFAPVSQNAVEGAINKAKAARFEHGEKQ